MRVIVREWAKRTGAPDGLTTAFIKQARQAKGLPRLNVEAFTTPVPNSCGGGGAQHLNPAKAAVELIRRQPLRLDASAVQLQSEWTLDTPIADMAQMVPKRCI